jgi:hypothetical protein
MDELDEIEMEEETLIHIGGMPFWIDAGTVIRGRKANYEMIKEPQPFGNGSFGDVVSEKPHPVRK